ncbi:MAG: HD-GYP domain-containing protein [Actinomycetota bacterium]
MHHPAVDPAAVRPRTQEAHGVALPALEDISLLLSTSHLPQTLSEEFFTRLLSLFGAQVGSIFLQDDDGELWRVAPRLRQEGEIAEAMQDAGAAVAAGRDPFLASGGSSHHLLAAPIRFNNAVLGSLVLARRDGSFDERDLGIATTLAMQFGLAIERARTQRELDRKIAEANVFEQRLETSAQDVQAAMIAERQRSEELAGALLALEQSHLATVRGLAIAVEAKDAYTAGHLKRVTRYASILVKLIAPGQSSDRQMEFGFLLHDIGKLGVPDAVLQKSGPLTPAEWELMKLHPETGRRILEDIPFLDRAKEIVYAHHERWDGAGYPRGLAGMDIPLGARIFPLADTFDAMTSDRPYRAGLPIEEARAEIGRGSGSQFWPDAVEAFMQIPLDELRATAAADDDDNVLEA